jgi:hypothetical protein
MTALTTPDSLPYPTDPNAPADALSALASLASAVQTALSARTSTVSALSAVVAALGRKVDDGFAVRPDVPTIRAMFNSGSTTVGGWRIPFKFGEWEYIGSPIIIGASVYVVTLSADRPADGIDAANGVTSHSRTWRADFSGQSGIGQIQPALYQYSDGRAILSWRATFGAATPSQAHATRAVHLGKVLAVGDATLVVQALGS